MSQKKLKVLHLIDTVGHGGAETVFACLIEALGNDIYDHHVLLSEEGWLSRKMLNIKDVDVYLENGSGRFNFKYILFLINLIKKCDIDLVHSHLFGTSLYSTIAGFLCRTPVVCTFHGFIDLPKFSSLTRLKFFLIGRLASRIVAVSDSLKIHMTKYMNPGAGSFITIYNGINLQNEVHTSRAEARKKLGFAEDSILVGAIGNVKKAKSYDVLIRIAEKIVAKFPECKFLIAGHKDNDVFHELDELLRQRGLESSVLFLGYLEEIEVFLRALDVFVLTSESEGFSLAIIEAMKACVPVVATRCGGPQEIIVNNYEGILADVGDISGLASGIETVLRDDRCRNSLIINAAKTVRERFSIEEMVGHYAAVYRSLASR